jgi:hypothetical protein
VTCHSTLTRHKLEEWERKRINKCYTVSKLASIVHEIINSPQKQREAKEGTDEK